MNAPGPIVVDTDPARLDLALVHGFLAASYWARGIPLAVVERSIRHSLCFGLYEGPAQIGFALREEMALTLEDMVMRRTGIGQFGPPSKAVMMG